MAYMELSGNTLIILFIAVAVLSIYLYIQMKVRRVGTIASIVGFVFILLLGFVLAGTFLLDPTMYNINWPSTGALAFEFGVAFILTLGLSVAFVLVSLINLGKDYGSFSHASSFIFG